LIVHVYSFLVEGILLNIVENMTGSCLKK